PEDVALDARAYRSCRAGMLEQVQRWWKARSGVAAPLSAARADNAPVVMVAVDTMHPDDPRHDAIRSATARVLSLSADFRLICVSVVHGERVGAQDGPGIHLEHLVRLRQWAAPLALPAGRVSLHVMEALSASATLLEFARNNHAELIAHGAPGPRQHALAWGRA